MRLMLVTGSFPPMQCGVGDYTRQLAIALAAIPGNHVAVLTSAECVTPPDGTASPEIFAVMKGWRLIELVKAISLMRRWRPDVVHIQYPTQGYRRGLLPEVLPLLGWLAGTRIVQTWHEPVALRTGLAVLLKQVPPGPIVIVRKQYLELIHPLLRRLVEKRRLRYIPSASSIPRARLSSEERDELRRRYLAGQQRLIVFFGFLYRHKGVDLLFKIADPSTDRLVIAGDTDHLAYKAELQQAADSESWAGKAVLTGFLAAQDVAELLSVADVVVLPFRVGGGEWNTSILGAVSNGAYVVTTSTTRRGYDADHKVHYAGVESVDEMRNALAYSPRLGDGQTALPDWIDIGAAHMALYRPTQVAKGAMP